MTYPTHVTLCLKVYNDLINSQYDSNNEVNLYITATAYLWRGDCKGFYLLLYSMSFGTLSFSPLNINYSNINVSYLSILTQ